MKNKNKVDWLVFFALILLGFILGVSVAWLVFMVAAQGGIVL